MDASSGLNEGKDQPPFLDMGSELQTMEHIIKQVNSPEMKMF